MSALRAHIEERDGEACVWCGRVVWPIDRTLDHVLARSRRGRTHAANLVLACRRCNRARRSKPIAAYAAEREAQGIAVRREHLAAALERLVVHGSQPERDYAARQLRRLATAAGLAR